MRNGAANRTIWDDLRQRTPFASHLIRYAETFVHQVADFIQGLSSGKMASPTFKDGLATDYVTDAVLKSAKTLRWEKVKKVK